MTTQQSRPDLAGIGAAEDAFDGNTILAAERAGFVVRGVVRLDLQRPPASVPVDDDLGLARRLQMLAYAPANADVVVEVAAGQFVPSLAVAYLRAEGAHLGSVTVESADPQTVRRWVLALRGEELTSW